MRIGVHLLADVYGVSADCLDDSTLLAECLSRAAAACGLTPLGTPVLHRFPGGGVTGVILLAESHIALHTYPERGYMALDIFTCGESDGMAALDLFRAALHPQRVSVTCVDRGAEPAS